MSSLTVDDTGVLKLLKGLDANKARGPDEIPAYIMKECAEILTPVLTKIFNQSLREGTLPADWLTANVCPIYKKGDRSLPVNYRPVSLTSVSCKIIGTYNIPSHHGPY